MLEKKKRNILLLSGLFIICLVVIGVSYAVWQLTLVQTEKNVVTTGCFKIEFTDSNPITLDKAYPISDEEGKALEPYQFTLTNTCKSEANYYINLETITNTSEKLNEQYLKASLISGEEELFLDNLSSSYINLDKVISEASNAYKLYQGVLKAEEKKTFFLNLWLDESTLPLDEVMNKEYSGKVTVLTSYKPAIKNLMLPMSVEIVEDCPSGSCFYSYYNNSYDQQSKYRFKLSKVVYENVLNPYENALEIVDFSAAQDKSVLGYYIGDENDVELHIQANGKIKVNPDASFFGSSGEREISIEGIENWDTSLVTNMSYMFYHASFDSASLSHFDTSHVTNMSNMFNHCDNTSLDLSSFDTSKVTDMDGMFYWMDKLTSLDLSLFDTRNVTNMHSMFGDLRELISLDISHFDTSKVTNMSRMFYSVDKLTSLDISHFDTSNVTDMSCMFSDMSGITSLDISHFDTSNVTNMGCMFSGVSSITSLDISHFDTSNATDMSRMFSGMSGITSLDLSHFDTQNVTNMSWMFRDMSNLVSLNGIHFNTSKVTNMAMMFYQCEKLTTLDLSSFDTRNVVGRYGQRGFNDMFYYDSALTSITYGPNFIYNNDTNVTNMFLGCPANKPTHESWNGVDYS